MKKNKVRILGVDGCGSEFQNIENSILKVKIPRIVRILSDFTLSFNLLVPYLFKTKSL